MRSIARCVWSLLLLTCTTLSQNAQPSPPAQELLTKGKELYTQEGPKAALPLFEEALKMLEDYEGDDILDVVVQYFSGTSTATASTTY